MSSLTNFFYKSTTVEKNNDYKEELIKILIKKRNNLTTIYALLDKYSQDTKKKMDVFEGENQQEKPSNVVLDFMCI